MPIRWLTIVCGAVLLFAHSTECCAQPILNRVEQLLRGQVEAFRQGGPAQAAAEPGYLGLVAEDGQGAPRGARIVEIVPRGPAERAGLQVGDVLIAAGSAPVGGTDDLARALAGKTAGTIVMVKVMRAGNVVERQLTLGRRGEVGGVVKASGQAPSPGPAPADAVAPRPRLGIRTLPVTEAIRQGNQLPEAAGAVVSEVTSGWPADRAGIPLGAVITAVDGRAVRTPQELAEAIGRVKGSQVELSYTADGQSVQKKISLAPLALAGDAPALQLRGRPVEAIPKNPPAELPMPSSEREAALEARIRELEQRLEKLEAALQERK